MEAIFCALSRPGHWVFSYSVQNCVVLFRASVRMLLAFSELPGRYETCRLKTGWSCETSRTKFDKLLLCSEGSVVVVVVPHYFRRSQTGNYLSSQHITWQIARNVNFPDSLAYLILQKKFSWSFILKNNKKLKWAAFQRYAFLSLNGYRTSHLLDRARNWA